VELETLPRLSVCITTRNRASVLPQTLRNILLQCPPNVEVVVLDGASTDGTPEIVRALQREFPQLVLVAATDNRGLDADYDRAVQRARGTYCWLFTDDDVLVDTAIAEVLEACADDPTVVIVDAAVFDSLLDRCYVPRRLKFTGERVYTADQGAELFRDAAQGLSFIGGLIVRREFWLARERECYFGSYFAHLGVLFQAPIPGHVRIVGKSLVRIRYGVASWTGRAFDIWMYKLPELVWSFDWLPADALSTVTTREPWRSLKQLVMWRAVGSYGPEQFELVRERAQRRRHTVIPWLFARVSGRSIYRFARLVSRLRKVDVMTSVLLDRSPFRSHAKST